LSSALNERLVVGSSSAARFIPSRRRILSRIELEIDAERHLIFESSLLQPASLLLHHEPRKIMKGLARARDRYLDGVRKTLVGCADDLNSFEYGVSHDECSLNLIVGEAWLDAGKKFPGAEKIQTEGK
jgi:hypothetical protein